METKEINQNNDILNDIILEIEMEVQEYYDYVSTRLDECLLELSVLIKDMNAQDKDIILSRMEALIEESQLYTKLYLYSFLVKELGNPVVLENMLSYIIGNNKLSGKTKYFIYFQLHSARFLNKNLETENTNFLIWKLFLEICNEFKEKLNIRDEMIPKEERNSDLIFVFVSQFLSKEHAPTKIVLDRCHTIFKYMKKKALIINTAECLTQEGAIPFFNKVFGNYIPEYLNEEVMDWKDIQIPFFQCENNMPNLSSIEQIVGIVKQLKPGWIIDIGGNTLTANICSTLVPAIAISLSPSDLTITNEQFQSTGKKIEKEDMELLKKLGKSPEHVIESVFTSYFKPQKQIFNRKDLNIPETEFILVIVGNRLEVEVRGEFLEMLHSLINYNIVTVFIGGFETYESLVDKFEGLKEKTRHLGYQEELLAVYECCDLYINPLRKGGGTSVAEAMIKGLPVVTIGYGDVATGAGEEFWVNDYQEMREKIIQYATDKNFYSIMTKKAEERAKILQNTDLEFEKIIKEAEKRLQIY